MALCLLSSHEGEIMECDSFESIVDYLKTTIPSMTEAQMEQTIAKVGVASFQYIMTSTKNTKIHVY